MGMYHSTYFAFGAKIADNAYSVDWEQFESGGLFHPTLVAYDVCFLMAGNYDSDKMFLTTYCKSVKLGEYERIDPFELDTQSLGWKYNLEKVAEAIKMPLLETPAWFCLPDMS